MDISNVQETPPLTPLFINQNQDIVCLCQQSCTSCRNKGIDPDYPNVWLCLNGFKLKNGILYHFFERCKTV